MPWRSSNAGLSFGLEAAVLLAAVVALWLPGWQAPVALIVLGSSFLASRRRHRLLVVGMVWLAATLIAAGLLVELSDHRSPRIREKIAVAYRALWEDLETAANQAAAAVVVSDELATTDQERAFATLQSLVALPRFERKTLLLFHPDGEAIAWAGEGLLHEVTGTGTGLPQDGPAVRRSFTAVTAMMVVALEGERRPWRLVVGRSLATDRWPFGRTGLVDPKSWSIGPMPSSNDDADMSSSPFGQTSETITVEGLPPLVFSWGSPGPQVADAWLLRRLAAASLALLLFMLALPHLRSDSSAAKNADRESVPDGTHKVVLWIGAALAMVPAAGLLPMPAYALVGGTTLAAGAGLVQRRRGRLGVILGGMAAVGGLLGVAIWLQQAEGIPALTIGFGGDAQTQAVRLGWFLACAGALAAAARLGDLGVGRWWTAPTIALVLAGAALHDHIGLALGLLTVGAVLSALRWCNETPTKGVLRTSGGILTMVMLSTGLWGALDRAHLRTDLEQETLPKLAPPTAAEISSMQLELQTFFERFDVAAIRPPAGGDADVGDLAFSLWRASPLPERDSLSALVVEPYAGAISSFSFDLPLDGEFDLVWDPSRLRTPWTDAWNLALIEGVETLSSDGEPWATVRYWLMPRPGFRLGVSEVDEFQTALLRGRPHRTSVDGLPNGVHYALYRPSGDVIVSPWREAPPLDETMQLRTEGITETPIGRCWFWTQTGSDGVAVAYLEQLTPSAGLARAAVHALGTIAVLGFLIVFAALVALPRLRIRVLVEQVVRSYSKRLILVYTLLLFVPLVALNLLLLRGFEDRLRREQLAQGEAALNAARTFLVNYVQGLEDGFSYDVLLDRELLAWLSSVVDHQVNLYWRSRLAASSQQALFTAGLLPRRIPGDVFTRLSLLNHDLGFRDRHTGELGYLEVYAPVRLAGELVFVLSVPLLEQEKEVAGLLAGMRQRAVLISAALFVALLALGSRLARSFTKPLTELIDGTRRIAGGAASLGLAPRELELEALARAIDDMARRIAEGRDRLVREKEVVERMVENITSGVVSLDQEGRVLMRNRVAVDLLSSEVGEVLTKSLARTPDLAPVLAFVAEGETRLRASTVQLPATVGKESREWNLTLVPLPGPGNPAALLVVDDATEALRGQRLAAWAEMARIIAHEIKNPLTPIRLSAEHMRQVYKRDPDRFEEVLERCTENILKQVDELRDIASDFSTYSRIPRADPQPGDLKELLAELVDAYQDASLDGVGVVFEAPAGPVPARIDDTLLGRAVRNLLENALRASAGTGDGEVCLRLEDDRESIRILVLDRGPGVAVDAIARIFEPYFSTHDSGTGLGLPIARRIVEEHAGTIEAVNRPGGGLKVVITMPGADLDNTEKDLGA